MKHFLDLKNKARLPIVLSALAAVFLLVAVIVYGATGVTNYTANKLDAGLIVFAILSMVVSCASVIFDLKLVKHAAFLLSMVAFFDYIVFEVDYIGSIFVGIDNTPVTAPFVITLLLFFMATVISLVCAIITVDPVDRIKGEQSI